MSGSITLLSQDGRQAELSTALGKDVLGLNSFDVHEGISENFLIHIECQSTTANVDFNPALGKPASIKFTTHEGVVRYFHGILTGAEWTGKDEELYTYRVTLQPWFWLLTLASDSRIFKNKTVLEIIKEVFDKAGFKDYRDATSESYWPLEFCVQYRETHHDFVCRLMEKFGIAFYFEHSGDKHELVLADSVSGYKANSDLPNVPLFATVGPNESKMQFLADWHVERQFITTKFTLNDYNYEKPNTDMKATVVRSVDFKTHDLERYDYPGGYKEKKHGDHFSIADDAGSYATFTRRSAHGHAPSLFAGTLTDVGTHPVGAENLKYLVTRATHHFARQQYRSRLDGGDGSEHYRGQYQLHAAYLPFKTQDHTPYARVHGPQTGKVVARDEKVPKNEEIDVDEQGRIFVEFFWDRKKTPSIPVRVAQVWAGAEFGAMFTPRIGMEVVVDFLEGDPDRPLVTGCVYNDTNKNPLKLPAEKNNTGWKSNSTLGGNGYNIIGFVDTKNEEALYQRAERDHYTYARYREIHNIAETYDGKTDGKNSYIVTVKHGNEKHHVDDGNRETKISGNDVETIGGNQTIKVGGNLSITAGTNGPGSKITIKIGQSTITMDDTSITLKSPQITLESMNTDIKADAIITINGKALVKIN